MKTYIKLALFLVILASPFVFFSETLAQGSNSINGGLQVIKTSFPTGPAQTSNLSALIKTVINWALYFSAVLAVIYIIVGGYIYITAAGDKDKAKDGRTALTNAIIGLVMIIFAYVIVQVIYTFLTSNSITT